MNFIDLFIKELFAHVFFNIEWIYFKINAFDLPSLLYDFDLYKDDIEVNLLCEALKMSDSGKYLKKKKI
jgi:hypothetical protein